MYDKSYYRWVNWIFSNFHIYFLSRFPCSTSFELLLNFPWRNFHHFFPIFHLFIQNEISSLLLLYYYFDVSKMEIWQRLAQPLLMISIDLEIKKDWDEGRRLIWCLTEPFLPKSTRLLGILSSSLIKPYFIQLIQRCV